MGATLSVTADKVKVKISERLSFDCWQVLRDARCLALSRRLPMHLDIEGCAGGDMGGLGALLIAQHKLGTLAIDGCDDNFAHWFNAIGVCRRCSGKNGNAAGCRRVSDLLQLD